MKRSATRSPSRTRPEPVFFTDRNLGKTFPGILRQAGIRVETHDDHFPLESTSDTDWLKAVGKKSWIVLTHDAKIRYTSRERDALMQARLRAFVLRGRAPAPALAESFVLTYRRVLRFLNRHRDPFIAKVLRHPHDPKKAGRVEMWLSYADWLRRQPSR